MKGAPSPRTRERAAAAVSAFDGTARDRLRPLDHDAYADVLALIDFAATALTEPAPPSGERWMRRVYEKDDRGLWHREIGVDNSGVLHCGLQLLGHAERSVTYPTPTAADEAKVCRPCREAT